jgi:dipeptidyl aminopeptidase/acylaminoacyl peptidase
MRKPITLAGIVILGLLAGGAAALLVHSPATPAVAPAASETPTTGRDLGDVPPALTTAAIAARTYPGGDLAVVQDLGDKGGYRSQVVSYPSDGFTVRALLNVPTAPAPPGGRPVIVFNHGFIPPREYHTTGGDYQYWIDGLTRAGYVVVKPDYRGHDQSEGPAVGGNWAPDYTYDVLNLVSSIKRYPGVNPTRIGMVGHSMGGGITARAAAASPDVKASILLAGVVGNANDVYYNWRRATPRPTPSPDAFGTGRQDLTNRYGEPKDNPEVWAQLAPTGGVAALAGPVQVQHSADDGEVPQQFSDDFVAAARQAGKGVEYLQYPSGGHQFSGTGGLVLQRMLAFLGANLR